MFDKQGACLALARACEKAGMRIAAKTAMIAMTTKRPINVIARVKLQTNG